MSQHYERSGIRRTASIIFYLGSYEFFFGVKAKRLGGDLAKS